jgi:hypothetical protein
VASSPAAEAVEADVCGNAVQPCADPVFTVDATQRFIGAQERFLGCFLSIVAVVEDSETKGTHAPGVAPVEDVVSRLPLRGAWGNPC